MKIRKSIIIAIVTVVFLLLFTGCNQPHNTPIVVDDEWSSGMLEYTGGKFSYGKSDSFGNTCSIKLYPVKDKKELDIEIYYKDKYILTKTRTTYTIKNRKIVIQVPKESQYYKDFNISEIKGTLSGKSGCAVSGSSDREIITIESLPFSNNTTLTNFKLYRQTF